MLFIIFYNISYTIQIIIVNLQMFLMTLGNIGDLWDAIHETDLVVIGKGVILAYAIT